MCLKEALEIRPPPILFSGIETTEKTGGFVEFRSGQEEIYKEVERDTVQ